MTKKTGIITILSVLILLFHINNAAATEIDPFKYFNVYSLGNIGTSADVFNTDIQGTTGAAGNAYFGSFGATNTVHNTYVLHTGGNANLYSGSYNGSIDIGGNADMHNISIAGSAYSGGDMVFHDGRATGVLNAAGTMTCYNAYCGKAEGGVTYVPLIDFGHMNRFFTDTSKAIGSMDFTGNARPYYSTLNLDVASGVNVFELNMTEIYATKRRIEINGPSDAIVYINAQDKIANLGWSMYWDYNNVSPNNVILNFPFATELDITGGYFNVLAPFANVDFNSGAIRGNLIAGNLYGGAQVNYGYFNYTPPSNPVPEPATIVLLGGGLAGLLGFRKKAKK